MSPESHQENFRIMVASDEATVAILNLQAGSLSDEDQRRLALIYNHFIRSKLGRKSGRTSRTRRQSPNQSREENDAAGDSEDVSATTPVSHTVGSQSTKWGAMFNVTEIEEPVFVRDHLMRFPCPEGTTDAVALLNKRPCPMREVFDQLNTPIPRPSSTMWRFVETSSSSHTVAVRNAVLQNLQTRINLTAGSALKSKVNQAIHNYALLMWYDFTRRLWPGTSGSRIGSRMEADLKPIVNAFFDGAEEFEGRAERWCNDIARWSQAGRKLHESLCEPFGEASILVLHEQLTPSFVENRITRGDCASAVKMIEHLRGLDIERITRQPYWEDLARGIRAHLCGPFDDMIAFCKARVSDKIIGRRDGDKSGGQTSS